MKMLLIVMFVTALCSCKCTDGGKAMNMQKQVEMLYPVVGIDAGVHGSGVVIFSGKDDNNKSHSLILTAKHVIGRKRKVLVTFYPNDVEYPATVVQKSKLYDLALLRVEHAHPYVAEFSTYDKPPVFTKVYKVGGGLSTEPFPGEGIISGHGKKILALSASLIFGDSGGAAYVHQYDHYYLVGILVAVGSSHGQPVSHVAFAHDMDAINEFLDAKQEE